MNDDGGGITIPHNNQSEEASIEAPIASDASDAIAAAESDTVSMQGTMPEQTPTPTQEPVVAQDTNESSTDAISSDTLTANTPEATIENPEPITASEDAGKPSHLTNNPFNPRSRYQPTTQNVNREVPQFFNDAIAANQPVQRAGRNRGKLFALITLSIGAVAFVALLVLVIIPLISNSILNQKLSANNREIRAVFNKYANFILNGTDSDQEIGNYDETKLYYITEVYRKDDQKALTDFYRKANEKYAKVKEKVNEIYSKDDEHRTKIASYSTYLSLSYSDAIYGDYSEKEFGETFLADGEEVAMQKVKDFYIRFETEDYSSTYVGDAIGYYETLIDIYRFYIRNGCDTKSDIFSGVCYEKYKNDPTFGRILDANDAALEKKRNTMMYNNECVYTQIWSIYDQIKD